VILNNLPTTTLPPALIGAHPTSFWAYLGWRNLHGALVHCGYDVPGAPDIRYHDWHQWVASWRGSFSCRVLTALVRLSAAGNSTETVRPAGFLLHAPSNPRLLTDAINAGAYFLDRIFGTVSPGYGKWLEKWNAKDGEKGEDGAKSG